MIGHPDAESKPDFACGAQVPPTARYWMATAKALSLPRSQPTTYFLIYYACRYYRFQWARDRGAFSRQKAPKCQSGRMT